MVRKRLSRAPLSGWEYQVRRKLSNTKKPQTPDFGRPGPNTASRTLHPAGYFPGTLGKVIPTCF